MMAKMTFLEEIRTMPIAMSTAEANKQHYEVPAEFYSVSCAAGLLPWARIRGVDVGVWGVPMTVVPQLVMGPYKKYSSGYWPRANTTFEESEVEGLRLVCSRAQLFDRQRVRGHGVSRDCSAACASRCLCRCLNLDVGGVA